MKASDLAVNADICEGTRLLRLALSGSADSNEYIIKIGHCEVARLSVGQQTSLPIASVLTFSDFDIHLLLEGEEIPFEKKGNFYFVTGFAEEQLFYERIQLAATRVKGNLSIRVGSLYAYHNFDNITLKAAALTVYGHRVLDDMLSDRTKVHFDEVEKYLIYAFDSINACKAILHSKQYRWDLVRWIISLSSVAGYISIAVDNLSLAKDLFKVCLDNSEKVDVSPVSSLNIVNGQLFYALTCFFLGDRSETERALRSCIGGFKSIVAAQDFFVNVWVIGDLLNATYTVRQAFILLVQLGFDSRPRQGIIEAKMRFSISTLQTPVQRLISAGFCTKFSREMQKL